MAGMEPLAVYDVAEAVRACAHDALAGTAGGPPVRSCVVWGAEIPADECDCGALAVTVVRLYPSDASFGEAGTFGVVTPCGSPYLVADLAVQILRCVAVPDEGEVSVPCATVQAEARIAHEDAHAVRNAVRCCLDGLKQARTISDYLVRSQVPSGPDGGCAGSVLAVSVEFIAGCCDESEGA